jgi:hypothetical protein
MEEGTMEAVREFDRQYNALKTSNKLTERWLQKLANISVSKFDDAIKTCNDGYKFQYIQNNPKPGDVVYINRYITAQLLFAVSAYLREGYVKAFYRNSELNPPLFLEEIEATTRMSKIAISNFESMRGCFSRYREDRDRVAQEQLEYLLKDTRVNIVFNLGLLLAADAAASSYNGSAGPKQSAYICSAIDNLRTAEAFAAEYQAEYTEKGTTTKTVQPSGAEISGQQSDEIDFTGYAERFRKLRQQIREQNQQLLEQSRRSC